MKRKVLFAAAVSLLGTGLSFAGAHAAPQEQHTQQQGQQGRASDAESPKGMMKQGTVTREARDQVRPRTISGSVTELRRVKLRDSKADKDSKIEQHTIAKVRIDSGTQKDKYIAVHLGPDSEMKRRGVEVSVGDRITASGVGGRLNGNPMLVAAAYKVGGKTVVTRAHRDIGKSFGVAKAGSQSGSRRAGDRM